MWEYIFLSPQVLGRTDSLGTQAVLFWVFITNQITCFQAVKVTEKNLGYLYLIGLWGGTAGWELKSAGEDISVDQQVERIDAWRILTVQYYAVMYNKNTVIDLKQFSKRLFWRACYARYQCASPHRRTLCLVKVHAYDQHNHKTFPWCKRVFACCFAL